MSPDGPDQGPAPSPGSDQSNLPAPSVEVTSSAPKASANFEPPEPARNEIPDVALPSREANPYDFFMNPTQGKAGGTGAALPRDPGKQFLLLVGGGLGVVIIILMLLVFLPKGDQKLALIGVNQAQTETLRICDDGTHNAQFKAMTSFAENCTLSMTSQTTQLSAYLGKVKANIKGKVLARGYNQKSTEALAAAESSSHYDDTFKTVAANQLAVQLRSIQTAYNNGSTTNTEKKLLKDYADQTKLLQQALNQN